MSYIQYNDGRYSLNPSARPTNQSQLSVLKKIAERLVRLIDSDKCWSLTSLQRTFVTQIVDSGEIKLKELGIDIAHNISISAIMHAIVYKMNNPGTINPKDVENFVDAIVTTEDDDSKENVKSFFNALKGNELTPEEKIELANAVISRLNKTSKNLLAAHRSPNRSLGSNQDPHVAEFNGTLNVLPYAKNITNAFHNFSSEPYYPKIRKFEEEIQYQSSSVSKLSCNAWGSLSSLLMCHDLARPGANRNNKGVALLMILLEKELNKEGYLKSKEMIQFNKILQSLKKSGCNELHNSLLTAANSMLSSAPGDGVKKKCIL